MAIKRTSRLIVADRNYNFLLGQRPFSSKQRAGKPDFFGGAVNPGEPAVVGAVRELYEESGLSVGERVLAHVYRERDRDGKHTFQRDYYFGVVDSFDEVKLTEHIGSVALPAAEVLQTLTFKPDRAAMQRIVRFLPSDVLAVA